MKRIFEITEDGSHTLYLPEMDEHFHSTHGAIQESMHIFIQNGLNNSIKEELFIFEVGFGTGLNALLTLQHQNNKTIHYYSIEKYPLSKAEYNQLNYPKLINENLSDTFKKMHNCNWDEAIEVSKGFHLTKLEGDLQTDDLSSLPEFDLIYFDAFAPSKQVDMWSEKVLKKVADKTRTDGIFTTYTAKGDVRRALIRSGFDMKRVPGPPGKREILFGRKN